MVTLTATRKSLALDSLVFLAYLIRDGMNEKMKKSDARKTLENLCRSPRVK